MQFHLYLHTSVVVVVITELVHSLGTFLRHAHPNPIKHKTVQLTYLKHAQYNEHLMILLCLKVSLKGGEWL